MPGIATSDSEQIHHALKQAAEAANTGLRAFQTKNGLEPCGATLIICVLTRQQLHFLSIGDSLLLSSSGGLVLQKLNCSLCLTCEGKYFKITNEGIVSFLHCFNPSPDITTFVFMLFFSD